MKRYLPLALAMAAWLSACTSLPWPAPSAPVGLVDVMQKPAERALYEGMRAYDGGQYAQAETALRRALSAGLANGRDQAVANKLLAFITCTTSRVAECEAFFRAARAADPGFALNRAESGHPQWGPVYQRTRP